MSRPSMKDQVQPIYTHIRDLEKSAARGEAMAEEDCIGSLYLIVDKKMEAERNGRHHNPENTPN